MTFALALFPLVAWSHEPLQVGQQVKTTDLYVYIRQDFKMVQELGAGEILEVLEVKERSIRVKSGPELEPDLRAKRGGNNLGKV